MAHAFKSRAGSFNGQPITIIRAANTGDVDTGTVFDKPHFLVMTGDGEELVAPVDAVEITPVSED